MLPKGYDVPNKAGNYMKWADGANRFRILTAPIIGWEAWVDLPDGGRKPIRTTMDNPFTSEQVPEGPEGVKHFWAFVVWNYQENRVQILEVTQKGIQKSLQALDRDDDWGDFTGYDIVVTRTGQKLETEYSLQPKPAKELDKKIKEEYMKMSIKLEALYTGDDPFAKEGKEDINPDDIPL